MSGALSPTRVQIDEQQLGKATGWKNREQHAAINKHVGDGARDINSIDAWLEDGIPRGQLGLNKNGKRR